MFTDFRDRKGGERGRGGETGTERETSNGCLPYPPNWGSNPGTGIKPATFWYTGLHSNQLSHPARTYASNIFRKAEVITC